MILPMRDSVTVHMKATPEQVWRLVSDVTRIGEFSPETFEAEWLDGADGPAVGARFRGHVKRNERGPVYWTTCTVRVCEPATEFAFTVDIAGRAVSTWGYRLRPDGTGTAATEYFELTGNPVNRLYWLLAGRWRSRTNQHGMEQTLARIKRAAESREP